MTRVKVNWARWRQVQRGARGLPDCLQPPLDHNATLVFSGEVPCGLHKVAMAVPLSRCSNCHKTDDLAGAGGAVRMEEREGGSRKCAASLKGEGGAGKLRWVGVDPGNLACRRHWEKGWAWTPVFSDHLGLANICEKRSKHTKTPVMVIISFWPLINVDPLPFHIKPSKARPISFSTSFKKLGWLVIIWNFLCMI